MVWQGDAPALDGYDVHDDVSCAVGLLFSGFCVCEQEAGGRGCGYPWWTC